MNTSDSVSALESRSGVAKPVRRDAIGAEIPVTVHASRTTQGLGKNLPAVHEDTKTVIVLQQGAVVRLTANLMTGETVVLTNRMTGADILCRVGKVKSQPGIQHYVDLEFMQRAPSFWGDALAAVSAPVPDTSSATLVAPPPAPIAAPVAVVPQPLAPVAAPANALRPVPAALVPPLPESAPPPAPAKLTSVAPMPTAVVTPLPPVDAEPAPQLPPTPAPVVELPVVAAAEALQTAPLAEPVNTQRKLPALKPVTPMGGELSDPAFGAIRAESVTVRSRKTLLAAAAALLLVLGGGAGGYWYYSFQTASASAAAMPPALTFAPPPAAVDLASVSALSPDPEPTELSVLPADSPTEIVIESQPAPAAQATVSRTQPSPVASPRTSAPAARRNSVTVGQLQAPKSRATAARMDSSVPPPPMIGAVSLGDTTAATALLAAEPAGPAPPLAVGGQLQQPQLISSIAAVYPSNARMQRIQGTVVLDALVDENGRVVETKVIAGPRPLVLAAQDAVRNWKYKPAELNGKPIAVHTKVSVRFNLQ